MSTLVRMHILLPDLSRFDKVGVFSTVAPSN